MKAINFDAFPLSLSRENARKVLEAFDIDAQLPRAGRELIVCVPHSGSITVKHHGANTFELVAEPLLIM